MKLNPNMQPLVKLRQSIGLGLSGWTLPIKDIEIGIPVDENVLTDLEEENGVLTYGERKIVIYIKDTRQDRPTLENDKIASKRFHFSECDTIRQMRRDGRFERYVFTTRDDGKFSVIATDVETKKVEEIIVNLLACRNCLKQFGRIKYFNDEAWFKITPKLIYEKITPVFIEYPKYQCTSHPSGNYNKDWKNTSKKIRKSVDYVCQNCKVNLINNKKLLHVHHKSGERNIDSPKNLIALCIVCHAKQPHHQWLKVSDEDRRTIESLKNRM